MKLRYLAGRFSKTKRLQITETQRTLLLLVLLVIGIGMIVYVNYSVEHNFTDSF